MVYTGKPSRGCQACRKRRIKCDEAEPSCSQCNKKGIECPGYRSQFDVAWRDQTTKFKKDQREQNGRPPQTDATDLSSSTLILSPRQRAQTPPFAILPHIDIDPSVFSLDFFFSHYAMIPKIFGETIGFLDIVYPCFESAPSDSPLRPAVEACAGILYNTWTDMSTRNVVVRSRPQYLKAVSGLRKALATSSKAKFRDDLLMTTMMLCMYEGLMSFVGGPGHAIPHIEGARALTALRAGETDIKPMTRKVLLAARHFTLGFSVKTRAKVPEEIKTMVLTDPLDLDTPLGYSFDDYSLEVTQLRERFESLDLMTPLPPTVRSPAGAWPYSDSCFSLPSDVSATNSSQRTSPGLWPYNDTSSLSFADSPATTISSTSSNLSAAWDVLDSALDLDARMLKWRETLPPSWQPVRVSSGECIPRSVRAAGMFDTYCDVYGSVWLADIFNLYAATRIQLLEMIQRLAAFISPEASGPPNLGTSLLEATTLSTISGLADDICAAVPCMLGDRTRGLRIDDMSAQYPHLPGETISAEYKRNAAAVGAWFLGNVMHLMAFKMLPVSDEHATYARVQLARIRQLSSDPFSI